jgi:hypothetical protein
MAAKKKRDIVIHTAENTVFKTSLSVEADAQGEWLSPDQIDYLRSLRSIAIRSTGGTNKVRPAAYKGRARPVVSRTASATGITFAGAALESFYDVSPRIGSGALA